MLTVEEFAVEGVNGHGNRRISVINLKKYMWNVRMNWKERNGGIENLT